MQVVCSKCKTRYNIPAEKLDGGVLKVRCRHCGHVFGVRKKKREDTPLPMEPLDITPHLKGDEPAEPALSEGVPEQVVEQPSEQPPEEAPPTPFGDFNLDDLALTGAPTPFDAPREEPPTEPPEMAGELLESGLEPELQAEPKPEPVAESVPPTPDAAEEPEEEFSFDDLSLDEYSTSPKPAEPEEKAPQEVATYDKFAKLRGDQSEAPDLNDLDLSEFDTDLGAPSPEETQAPARPTPPKPEAEPQSAEDFAKTLGELDLGSFDEEEEVQEEKPTLAKVSSEELLSIADTTPAKPVKAPKIKKPRGPFPWALFSLVLFLGSSVAFLAYNILTRPDAAFVLVNPFALSEIMDRNAVQKNLAVVEPLKGGYVDRDDKKRIYAVLAHVRNLTTVPVSGLKVRAKLFGAGGPQLAFRDAYCGNMVGKDEILGLPLEKVAQAGELQVGAAFANVDVKPGATVPCLVVFSDPPPDVEKYAVDVVGPSLEGKKPQ